MFNIDKLKKKKKSWSTAKLLIVQEYTENTNGDVHLMVENV